MYIFIFLSIKELTYVTRRRTDYNSYFQIRFGFDFAKPFVMFSKLRSYKAIIFYQDISQIDAQFFFCAKLSKTTGPTISNKLFMKAPEVQKNF